MDCIERANQEQPEERKSLRLDNSVEPALRQEVLQPNLREYRAKPDFSFRFSALVLMTRVSAGTAGALFMAVLRFVQHLAWSYETGDFQQAVVDSSFRKRLVVLAVAGPLAGPLAWVTRPRKGVHAAELVEAIWFASGRLPVLRTLGQAILAITPVGMGASLGREAAPKQAGAAMANLFSDWTNMRSPPR